MLHQSLLDLAEQAPRCEDVATVRGVLTESHELLRNALAHRGPEVELSRWYSTLVLDALHSPAMTRLTGRAGAEIILTGAIGRGDGLPTSRIQWLTVLADDSEDTDADIAVADLLTSVGLDPSPHTGGLGPATRQTWLGRIESAVAGGDAYQIGVIDDAGAWLREHLLENVGSVLPLLHEAIAHRPPALQPRNDLPDRDTEVDIRRDLLLPVTNLARWAGLTTRTWLLSTPDRIGAAQEAGILTPDEADFLYQGWQTGIELQFKRWADRVAEHEITGEDLPALQRSAFGAASRGVADVIRSLAERHEIAIPDPDEAE